MKVVVNCIVKIIAKLYMIFNISIYKKKQLMTITSVLIVWKLGKRQSLEITKFLSSAVNLRLHQDVRWSVR